MLDLVTRIFGYVMWSGLYMLGIGAGLYFMDGRFHIDEWNPAAWSAWEWMMAIGGGILVFGVYTALMLSFIHLARRFIHLGDKKSRSS